MSTSVEKRLATLRGSYDARRPNARTIASLRENPGCATRRVFDAARIDKAALAADLGHPATSGQSPFAITRGDRFEKDIKADGYAMAIALLRDHGFPAEPIRILPLRDLYPIHPRSNVDEILKARTAKTSEALAAMAGGDEDAYNLIDGGALEWDLGGAVARLETDGIAWKVGGRIHVAEIKSFPLVDGVADSDKTGAAAWQGAVYLSAIAELFREQGLPLSTVSTQLLLICPRNTSLQPALTPIDVSRHIRSLRHLIDNRASVEDLIQELPDDLSLDNPSLEGEARSAHLMSVIEIIGNRYSPSCLSSCELAGHCRAQAQGCASPTAIGPDAVAGLAGVSSLSRAAELIDGAAPEPAEEEATARLREVADTLERMTS